MQPGLNNRPIHPRPRPTARAGRKFGLHSILIIGVLATSLVIVTIIGAAMWNASASLSKLSTALLETSAHTTANTIETEIDARITTLEALAPRLQPGSRPAAINQPAISDWLKDAEILVAPDGQFPASLPQMSPATDGHGRRIAISNLFFTDSGQPRLAFGFASPLPDAPLRMLAVIQSPDRLLQGMHHHPAASEQLLLAVLDGNGRILARSRDADSMVGQQAPDWHKLDQANSETGTFSAQTSDGMSIAFAFHKLDDTPGWAVVVGEPLSAFNTRWQSPATIVMLANILGLMVALAAAFALARLILGPLRRLAEHSQRVVHGNGGEMSTLALKSRVREFDVLQDNLVNAQAVLHNRAEALKQALEVLAQSERRYRALAETGTLVSFRGDAQGRITSVTGWEKLTGISDAEAPLRWRRQVHPDDLPTIIEHMRHAFKNSPIVTMEFRVRTLSRGWRWVCSRSVPVLDADGAIIEWAGVVEDAHERHLAQEKIEYLAHHDSLTGLHSRAYLEEILPELLDDARLSGRQLAVHLIDIDKFKEVNDSAGHAAGDRLLRAIAAVVEDSSTPNLCVRWGGDEFIVVQQITAEGSEPEKFGNDLLDCIGKVPSITATGFAAASLGFAMFPQDGENAKSLMRHADMALYSAKHDPAKAACRFAPEMAQRILMRRELEKDLYRAVTERSPELSLCYQPQVRATDGKLIGYEALARWHHPVHGPISPLTFIPIAEETGIINELGRMVLEDACIAATQWPDDIAIAVNLSALQVNRYDLVPMVHNILVQTGLPPRRLELEVTESVLIRDRDIALHVLRQLKGFGMKIALDDFGTGFSSLEYLNIFPFDKVKIDKSFIWNMKDSPHATAIVKSITNLGEMLRFEVLAEGVTDSYQADALRAMGCEYFQGYLFGKPMDFADTLEAHQNRSQHG